MDWVESDDFPRDIAAAAADVDFFLSDDLADPIGKTEGEGKGKAALVLPGVGFSDTMFPILSDFGPPLIVLAGKVLTVMFFPHPAELGNADAASVSNVFASALAGQPLLVWLVDGTYSRDPPDLVLANAT